MEIKLSKEEIVAACVMYIEEELGASSPSQDTADLHLDGENEIAFSINVKVLP